MNVRKHSEVALWNSAGTSQVALARNRCVFRHCPQ